MLNFSPPPRQQVLYGIRIQADRIRDLMEDLRIGSETAVSELMDVASHVYARGHMYQWPQVVVWASVLEERLSQADADGFADSDLLWLEKHVRRLDSVLRLHFGDETSDVDQALNRRRTKARAAPRPAPPPLTGEGGELIELDYDWSLEHSPERPASAPPSPSSLAPVPVATADGDSGELDANNRPTAQPPPVPLDDSSRPTIPPANLVRGSSSSPTKDSAGSPVNDRPSRATAVPPGLSVADRSSRPTAVPPGLSVADRSSRPTAVPPGLSVADRSSRSTTPPADAPAAGRPSRAAAISSIPANGRPSRSSRLSSIPSAGRSSSLMPVPGESGEISVEGRAQLAKVDLQRVVLPQKRLGTELEGPLQYVIVSVSNDSELQRWLGRVLPERRFELLTARGPAEGESLCREHQPDLLLLDWEHDTDFAQQSLARIRDNPLTHYVRVAFVTPEESLAAHFAAIRLGAMGVIPRTAKPKDVFARVMLCVLAPGELPAEELGETTMSEFSALLLRELRVELEAIQGVVGDVSVPVGGELGRVLRDTSRRLRDEVKGVLGGGASARAEGGGVVDEQVRAELFQGKRALVMEADRLRRAELTRAVGELGLELLTPMPDLTKALEAGLAWAPDVLVGGAPEQDSVVCARILRHDIALSSMSVVVVRWPDTGRQWPDARADMELLRPWLEQRLVDAFAPAAEVKRQLQGQQAVTGRVESCGMFALLQLALTHRQQACLNIREGTDQFQAFLYQGTIHDVIWREGDGTETRQFDAFARMLAVSRGGFMVDECKEMPDPSLPGTFGDLLTAACHWWRPLSLVVDQRLLDVQPLTLDRRRTAEFRRQSGQVHRRVVKALRSGVSPAQIIDEGVEAGVVADVLRELVRRFAVRQLPVGA